MSDYKDLDDSLTQHVGPAEGVSPIFWPSYPYLSSSGGTVTATSANSTGTMAERMQYLSAPVNVVAVRGGLRSNSIEKKIQIQMQKQEEETRLFNETMQDAQMVKQYAGGQAQGHQPHHLMHHANINIPHSQLPHGSRSQHLIPSYPPYPRGGSLPNVNQMANQSIDLRNALDHLEILTSSDRDPSRNMQRHPSPTPHTQSGQRRHYSPKRPMEYEVSRMPSYLTPPESSQLTKRAHSDSALHQSANPHMMHDGTSQQMHMVNFAPPRRSPVPQEKMTDPNFAMWNDPSKMAQNQNRPKSCEIPVVNAYADASRQQQQQQQQQQQHGHLLSPTSIQPSPIPNPSTGSLPDLTNPSMNFPTLVSPLDPEENAQSFANNNNGHPGYRQVRAPGSHSPSTSPQPRRASAMRSATDVHNSSQPGASKSQKHKQQPQQQQQQHPPPPSGNVYNDRQGNRTGYVPYQHQQPAPNNQNFGQYRSNSNSPSMHEQQQLALQQQGSNPASPGSNAGMPNMAYSQDQQYLEMHQTVQQKFEQIDIDQNGNHQQRDPYMDVNMNNLMYDLLRSQADDMNSGQIPNIIFTGADESGLRDEYASFFANAGASSSHPYPHNGIDPGYSSQESQDHHVDLMAELSKLDQYDLGMLTDETLRNMVDPEAEEQFRLDSAGQ